jgi:hypothetical protein
VLYQLSYSRERVKGMERISARQQGKHRLN